MSEPKSQGPQNNVVYPLSHQIVAAFQFLSRIPIRKELDFTPDLLRRSAVYYPLVGASIGICVWGAGLLFAWLLPSWPAAVLALMVWVWLTGGLHLDGWMDTADGLLSYRSRERMLEIMKDSRVGAMGVLACMLLVLLKLSLVFSLLQSSPVQSGLAIMTAAIWSRWFMTRAMQRWPKARQGEGLAGQFRTVGGREAQESTLLALLLTIAIMLLCLLLALQGMEGDALMKVMLYMMLHPFVAWGAGTWAAGRISHKLGGLTGDTYGALNEGLEALLLLLAVLILL
ncbi:adenosylcobinamide-GDP ribazoletransferase [Paenibacillus sanguinis]|uniref:adenosylcobinamide-GDP ribazoletransferase n=1 Tax=Paenibacillus sanguinis TaxID=225906 RepID=UPI0003765737|nr:adenosylcobinamide-GDP ribazoletransferase [Paenibacillus sanguinis]